ncbi:MAG: flagellar export chaperone FliS [Candidatus Latescibacteria bacterium]|nr:flagellar export chaperone FliS [Candidatus Latescibacterota bacterium]
MVNVGNYHQYRQVQVTTSGRVKLVVMLYNGAIRSLKRAVELLEKGEMGKKGDHIIKAQDILMELNLALDMKAGGEIARNLRRIYLYVYRTLSEANFHKSTAKIEEAIKLLSVLNDAWEAVAVGKTDIETISPTLRTVAEMVA